MFRSRRQGDVWEGENWFGLIRAVFENTLAAVACAETEFERFVATLGCVKALTIAFERYLEAYF